MSKAIIALAMFLSGACLLPCSRAGAQARIYALAVSPKNDAAPVENAPDGGACSDIKSGTVNFAPGSVAVTADQKQQLSALAADMRAHPNCRMVIQGHGGGGKVDQQASWDHVTNCINYLADVENIDRGRFIFQYGALGDVTLVDYRVAGENEEGAGVIPTRPQR